MTQKFGRNSRLMKLTGGMKFGTPPTPRPARSGGQNYLHWPAIGSHSGVRRFGTSHRKPSMITRLLEDGRRFGFTAHDDCRPRRTLQERHQSRAAAEGFLAAHHRHPSTAELNTLANKVYKSVYPGGPYPIPSASHPCAKTWNVIRALIVKRLKAAATKPGPKKRRRKVRKSRTRARGRRYSGTPHCPDGQHYSSVRKRCIDNLFSSPTQRPASGSAGRSRSRSRSRRRTR